MILIIAIFLLALVALFSQLKKEKKLSNSLRKILQNSGENIPNKGYNTKKKLLTLE